VDGKSTRRTVGEIATAIGGEVIGDPDIEIRGVAGIREAAAGDLTFLANPRYEKHLESTGASAVIISSEMSPGAVNGRALIVVDNPYGGFARVVGLFEQKESLPGRGVHSSAVVAESAALGDGITVGPAAVVAENVTIGDRTAVCAGVYVGPGVTIGADTIVYPNVTIKGSSVVGSRVIIHPGAVIGSCGFGFAREGDDHRKIPQIGRVVIEDDVEIGANVCIDRATVGATRICRGTKIDNLVQIGHNVVIGEGSIVVAQVGISGSTEVGKHVVLAGQAGLAGHIVIGDNAMVAAQSGVTRSVPPGERVSGYPAQKHSRSKRLLACWQRLPALFKKVTEIERRLRKIEEE